MVNILRISKVVAVMIIFSMLSTAIIIMPEPAQAFRSDAGNGNQDAIYDPYRDLVYGFDTLWGGLRAYDKNGNSLYKVTPGYGLIAMDMNADGSRLYVLAKMERCISVVDLDTRTIVDQMSLSFEPQSISCGAGGIVFVSCSENGTMCKIDMTTKTVLWKGDTGGIKVLECSPDGSTLLAFDSHSESTNVMRYDVSGTPALVDTTTSSLGSYFQQAAVDWSDGYAYVALLGNTAIKKVSVATLDTVSDLPVAGNPTCVLLNFNETKIYALSSGDDGTRHISVFNEGEATPFATRGGPYDYRLILIDRNEEHYIIPGYICVSLYANFYRSSPFNGEVLGYTPVAIDVYYEKGLYSVEITDARMFNKDTLTVMPWNGSNCHYSISEALPDGSYTVNLTYMEADLERWYEFTFVIDHDSPNATMPSVDFMMLPNEGVGYDYGYGVVELSHAPDTIAFWLNSGSQRPIWSSFSIKIDDTEYEIEDRSYVDGSIVVDTGNMTPGEHVIVTTINWLDGTSSYLWELTIDEDANITSVTPSVDGTVHELPTVITADLELGYPIANVLNVTLLIDSTYFYGSADGDIVTVEIPDDHWNISNDPWLGYLAAKGWHYAVLTIETDRGTITKSWNFEIDIDAPVMDTTAYDYHGKYNIPIPIGWTVKENATAGSTAFDMSATSTQSVFGVISVVTGRDDSLKEDHDYLEKMMEKMTDQLSDQSMTIVGDPDFTMISGHEAIVFSVSYSYFTERVAIIVSEEHDQYWMIVFLAQSYLFDDLQPVMNNTISGFEILKEESPMQSTGDYLPYIIVIGAVAAAAMIGVVLLRVKKGRQK